MTQLLYTVPALPASRMNNARQRGPETPSHGTGLSETARQKLDERRKERAQQRGAGSYHFYRLQ